MHYVCSDIHGQYDLFRDLLRRIDLQDSDTLYILGDVIDRGPDGIKILMDMMGRKNVIPIIGNHESLALSSLKLLRDGASEEALWKKRAYCLWMISDGEPTAAAFRALHKETQAALVAYIESFSVYEEITVDGRRFHLSHTLPDYRPRLDIHDVTLREFIWGDPNYTVRYGENARFITGHTPTHVIDPAFFGKIWQGCGHIAIDCAAAWGGRLGCLCLETMKEYYV